MSATTAHLGDCSIATLRTPQDLYRILLLRKNGSDLLVAGTQPPFMLPCIEIPKWERVAENMNAAMRRRYGISALCLFTPEVSSATTCAGTPLYQVMEARGNRTEIPDETCWLPLNLFSDCPFADGRDSAAISEMLRLLTEFQTRRTNGPFGRPAWIEELFSWAQHATAPWGLHLTGEVRQLNASQSFALLRLETNGPALWFKAVGEPNLREFSISITLSRLFPGFVPPIIATHSTWNGWLTTEIPYPTLAESPDPLAWELAVETLAELQITSLGKTTDLLDAGCRDLRASSLLAVVDPFMEVVSELMVQQQKAFPPALTRDELRTLGIQITEALSELAQLDIPNTLGHLDFNPGNILCSKDQCVFLDWAEAYIGAPFFSAEYLRVHQDRLKRRDRDSSADLARTYEMRWGKILSPETISAMRILTPALAVFAYAAGTDSWRNPILLRNPSTAAYFRSLTRRMRGEVAQFQNRRRTCRTP
jgi:hypothetical protein